MNAFDILRAAPWVPRGAIIRGCKCSLANQLCGEERWITHTLPAFQQLEKQSVKRKKQAVASHIELEARIAAIEMVLVTQILQSGLATPGFDPRAFATSRRDAWHVIGQTMCVGCESESEDQQFTRAYAKALDGLGEMLVALSEPVHEAIEEIDGLRSAPND